MILTYLLATIKYVINRSPPSPVQAIGISKPPRTTQPSLESLYNTGTLATTVRLTHSHTYNTH